MGNQMNRLRTAAARAVFRDNAGSMERVVFFVSDRTGITVEGLGHSLLSQFSSVGFRQETRRFVDTPEKARALVEEINRVARETGLKPIVFATLIEEATRAVVAAAEGVFLDFVDAFIGPLELELGVKSSHTVGRTHGLVDVAKYNLRINAVNYALSVDDGLNVRDYPRCDVIVLGVSRSGKTPTCLYLALTHGIFAANFPLTPEELEGTQFPTPLTPYRRKLFGLSIRPERLQQIRRERRPEAAYSSLRQCEHEITQAEALYRQEGIPYLDATAMSVEEIAATILQQLKLDGRLG
jgi:regulator of PEP synthase PpsR (kinase-PPPase family)